MLSPAKIDHTLDVTALKAIIALELQIDAEMLPKWPETAADVSRRIRTTTEYHCV